MIRNNRNEATGNIINNGIKGKPDAYAEGLAFVENPPAEWVHDYNRPRILQNQAEADDANAIPVPSAFKVTWVVGDTCYWHRVG